MNFVKDYMTLYAVTDRTWTTKENLYAQVEQALKGGVTCVQLREKELNDDDFLKEALEIKILCNKYNIPFVINDNVDIAIKCGADGVHTGQTDLDVYSVRQKIGDKMFLGISAQTVEQALTAQKYGADYLGVGAVFSTSTKLDADTVSLETLREICQAVSIPVIAIGGIYNHNIEKLAGTGICGVALVSAIFASKDITKECKSLKILCEKLVQYEY